MATVDILIRARDAATAAINRVKGSMSSLGKVVANEKFRTLFGISAIINLASLGNSFRRLGEDARRAREDMDFSKLAEYQVKAVERAQSAWGKFWDWSNVRIAKAIDGFQIMWKMAKGMSAEEAVKSQDIPAEMSVEDQRAMDKDAYKGAQDYNEKLLEKAKKRVEKQREVEKAAFEELVDMHDELGERMETNSKAHAEASADAWELAGKAIEDAVSGTYKDERDGVKREIELLNDQQDAAQTLADRYEVARQNSEKANLALQFGGEDKTPEARQRKWLDRALARASAMEARDAAPSGGSHLGKRQRLWIDAVRKAQEEAVAKDMMKKAQDAINERRHKEQIDKLEKQLKALDKIAERVGVVN